jgi:hypothetical protein
MVAIPIPVPAAMMVAAIPAAVRPAIVAEATGQSERHGRR